MFTAGSFVGRSVRRVEDPRLLRGEGTYIANMSMPGLLELMLVRSTVAHGRLTSIDTSEAREMPGVAQIFTAADLPIASLPSPVNPACGRPPMAADKVRFVGDIIAVVAAQTRAQAVDAAENVIADYEMLDAVIDAEGALDPGAPVLFDEIGSNLVNGVRDPGDALSDAEVIVRGRFVNQRLAVAPMEGAAILVVPGDDGEGHELTIHVGVQMPHMSLAAISTQFGIPADRIRLIAPDMGGAFGGKNWAPEHSIAVAVARRLGCPVRWVEARSENMISMHHGRSQIQYMEMGFQRDGLITGMRTRIVGDGGAYGGFGGLIPMFSSLNVGQGPYAIPKIVWDVAVAVTNTTPTGPYRGAGRPEAAGQLERIMDLAADELGIDPAELRRRNYLRPEDFPLTTLMGAPYDSGRYADALDEALRLAEYDALLVEQSERRDRNDRLQLGVGIASYIEASAPPFGDLANEFAAVEIHQDGTATLRVGTSGHGQGHATTFSMIAADRLGIDMDSIIFVQSDTARVPRGGGTAGSRSAQMGGSAVLEAADLLAEKIRQLAADVLEAAPEDIVVLGGGSFGVAGVPSVSIDIADLAVAAEERGQTLAIEHVFTQATATFPFGTHVSVVLVDIETGAVDIVKHVAVDDCGRLINPMIVEGQVHGGLASGIAQALFEHVQYDEIGNPLTGQLLDYLMPSAADLPSFVTAHTVTPSPQNPLGAKGVGESGTTGATPAVQNAVIDALSHLGVRHIELPCTPERVWRAVEEARSGKADAACWTEPPAVFASLPIRPGPPRVAAHAEH